MYVMYVSETLYYIIPEIHSIICISDNTYIQRMYGCYYHHTYQVDLSLSDYVTVLILVRVR